MSPKNIEDCEIENLNPPINFYCEVVGIEKQEALEDFKFVCNAIFNFL